MTIPTGYHSSNHWPDASLMKKDSKLQEYSFWLVGAAPIKLDTPVKPKCRFSNNFNLSYLFWRWYDWTSSFMNRTFSSWVPWSTIPVLNFPEFAFRQPLTLPLISIKLFSLVEAINDRFADSISWMDSIRSSFWLMSKTTPRICSIMVPSSSEPMHETVLHIFTRGYSLSSILILLQFSTYLLKSHHGCEGFI